MYQLSTYKATFSILFLHAFAHVHAATFSKDIDLKEVFRFESHAAITVTEGGPNMDITEMNGAKQCGKMLSICC